MSTSHSDLVSRNIDVRVTIMYLSKARRTGSVMRIDKAIYN